MAHGSTAHESIAAVKATVGNLEVSPSHCSASSPIAHGGSKATGHGVKSKTAGRFGGKTTRPKPHGTSKGDGKKNLMAGKSHGR